MDSTMVGLTARTALFLGCLVLSGCASSISSESTLAKRLADRGPVPLSPDNPFIASNLLLNKEMERSPELKGFIDHRGQPGTLEVERSLLGALRMTLFYPDKGERYTLERVDSTWVISGPSSATVNQSTTTPPSLPGEDRSPSLPVSPAGVPAAPENLPPAPTLVTASRITPPEPSGATVVALPSGTSFSSPAHPLTPADESARAALKQQLPALGTTPVTIPLPENRADLLARLITASTGRTAETSPRGDLVHYVTNQNETLPLIAEWYTDSPLNGPRIARMNGRRPNDTPAVGDSIIVPSYLVTNRNRLSDEAITALTEVSTAR